MESKNGEVLLNSTGYTGKKRLIDGGFSNDQMKLTANTIVFTRDAWNTCMTILGYVSLDSFITDYGLNAQAIIGKLILSDRLKIYDSSGQELFTVIDGKIEEKAKELTQNFDKQIDSVNKTIGDLTFRMDDFTVTLEELQDVVSRLTESTVANASAISEVQNELSVCKEDIIGLRNDVDSLGDQIDSVNQTIGNVPDGSTVVQMIDDAVYDDAAIKEDIETIKSDIETINAKIEALQSNVS